MEEFLDLGSDDEPILAKKPNNRRKYEDLQPLNEDSLDGGVKILQN